MRSTSLFLYNIYTYQTICTTNLPKHIGTSDTRTGRFFFTGNVIIFIMIFFSKRTDIRHAMNLYKDFA